MAKTAPKHQSRDGDQYMIRMPSGLRDRVAARAMSNGRSISAEIVDAIEQHLLRADRISQIWEFFQLHRAEIESIPLIQTAVERLELYAQSDADFRGTLMESKRSKERQAQEAALPVITPEQANQIRKLLKDKGASEENFLKAMNKVSIEEIRDFNWAMILLKDFKKPKA